MTDHNTPRAKAVEAAALALVNRERVRFELPARVNLDVEATGHIHAREIAQAAIAAYLATMAEAGWVMVPATTIRKVTDRRGPRGGHLPLSGDIEALADACRAAMLGREGV